jgi:threonine synthase
VGEATIADGIAVGLPRNARKAARAVKESHGAFTLVSDDQIRDAMCWLGRLTGIFGEPAAAAGIAGLRKAVAEGIIGRTESVACVITGNGLKDVKNAVAAAGAPQQVAPTMAALAAVVPPELA